METVVFVLMILVCFNFMLKQTYRKLRSVLVISVICALFVGLMWPYAIEQSKTQIADWLANPALMLDTSVVLSVEVVLQMTFCMLAAHIQSAGPVKKRVLWAYKALRWFPGILVFPVLFCGLVALIFSFPRGILFPDCLEHGSGGIRIDTCRELPFALVTARKRTSAGIAFPRQCPDCYFGNYRYCQRPYGSERDRRGRLGSVGRLDNPACCRCIGRNDFKKSEIEKTN